MTKSMNYEIILKHCCGRRSMASPKSRNPNCSWRRNSWHLVSEIHPTPWANAPPLRHFPLHRSTPRFTEPGDPLAVGQTGSAGAEPHPSGGGARTRCGVSRRGTLRLRFSPRDRRSLVSPASPGTERYGWDLVGCGSWWL